MKPGRMHRKEGPAGQRGSWFKGADAAGRLLRRWPFSLLACLLFMSCACAKVAATGVATTGVATTGLQLIFAPRETVAALPIHWIDLPRPSPQPPLDHGALLVPVFFEGLQGKALYMQFDLGHPTTVLYANKWATLGPRLQAAGLGFQVADSAVRGLRFRVGDLPVSASTLALLPNNGPGIDWNGEGVKIIGTLGADLIPGCVVVMDFKADRIQIATDRSLVATPSDRFTPFQFKWRRILIPALVDGKAKRIIYDSGSSAFALITDETSWARMSRPGGTPVSFPIKSWKRTLTAHVAETDSILQIGSVTLPIKEVSHIQGTSWMQRAGMRLFGIGGMSGNRLFLGRRVIIDTARQEIAIGGLEPGG